MTSLPIASPIADQGYLATMQTFARCLLPPYIIAWQQRRKCSWSWRGRETVM